ncbi:MAG TPA: ABC transporter permease subunit [Anaerolineales bacterium]|nr:ABC transporter permease subunit [Anaerolineales bacterium]
MNPMLIIARLTFREAVRRRIALAALLLGLAFLILYSLGFHFINLEMTRAEGVGSAPNAVARREIYNFMTMAGLYAVTFLSVAMGALVSADTLAGEIGSGAIQSIVTKPVRRAEVVFGKWLGFAGLLALYLLLMAGGVAGSVWVQARYAPPNFLRGVGLIYLESLLIMSITLMCSSLISTLATGGVVFGLYGLAFIGGWVEQIGSFLGNQTAVNIGILSSLIIPSEALWKRAAFEMQSPLVSAVGFSPFSARSIPSPFMIVYAAGYALAALVLAMRWFSRRDL